MKALISIATAILLIGLFGAVAAAEGRSADRDRLVGAWKLVALEQPGPDGKVNRTECCGMFVFTADGHLSVQVMQREPKPQTAAERYSQGGYEASYGSFVVDENRHTFTFHIDGALVRNLIGKDLQRVYKFQGDRLIVKSARPDEHWRVIWEHY